MTTTTTRRLNGELRQLRAQWRRTVTGEAVPWGVPWCSHRAPEPSCEGCCTRLWCRDLAAPIAERAAAVKAELAGAA